MADIKTAAIGMSLTTTAADELRLMRARATTSFTTMATTP